MGFIQAIKDKVNEMLKENEERKKFRKFADEQTKEIRRTAYLKKRMEQAAIEGELIAQREFEKNTTSKQKPNEFGIDKKIIDSTKEKISTQLSDPYKYIQQPIIKNPDIKNPNIKKINYDKGVIESSTKKEEDKNGN